MLRDLARERASVRLGHPVVRLDLVLGVDLGLEAGEIPLLLLFSGTVFVVTDGRLRVEQVPWSKEISCGLPAKVWREAVDAHFPDSAWVTLSRDTLDELMRFKTRHALPTWDATLRALLTHADRYDGPAGISGDDR